MCACVEEMVSTHHSEVLLITKTTEKADTDISKGISFTNDKKKHDTPRNKRLIQGHRTNDNLDTQLPKRP